MNTRSSRTSVYLASLLSMSTSCARLQTLIALMVTFMSCPLLAEELPKAQLHLVARRGDLGITTIRPGISINNRGSVAFGSITADGRSTIMVRRPGEKLQELYPGLDAVGGYGVQINDADEVAFLSGPGISIEAHCSWNTDPFVALLCGRVEGSSTVTYSIGKARPSVDGSVSLMSSVLINDFPGGSPSTLVGPYTTLGPALSINNAGDLLFVADTGFAFGGGPRPDKSYVISFRGRGEDPTKLSVLQGSPLAHPLVSEPGRFALNSLYATNGSILVFQKNLSATVLADESKGYSWVGQYPGISDNGRFVAFTGHVGDAATAGVPAGGALFLSVLVSNRWETLQVVGTNDIRGTNIFQRFHPSFQTCVQALDDTTVGLCFAANLSDGRTGIFSATYDVLQKQVLSLQSLLESGRDLNAKNGKMFVNLGRLFGMSLHDSLNQAGQFAIQVETTDGPILLGGSILSEIKAFDPAPPEDRSKWLIDDNAFFLDPMDLAKIDAREVTSLCADGVTRVLLKLPVPNPGIVRISLTAEDGGKDEVGTLSSVRGSEQKTQINVKTLHIPGEGEVAFAVLRSPTNFPNPANIGRGASRTLRLEARLTDSNSSAAPLVGLSFISLFRSPVVLMHGLWSDSQTWGQKFLADERFTVYAHDYRDTHSRSFSRNSQEAFTAIVRSLRKMRLSNNAAATQVDFVGHSMGGLLGRIHTTRDAGVVYKRPDNFEAGDIHKLVTIDTPHSGSSLASELITQSGSTTLLGDIMEAIIDDQNPHDVDGGAVYDLRNASLAIALLGNAPVPSHAIVGSGGRRVMEFSALDLLGRAPLDLSIATALRWTGRSDIFGDQDHDLLVSYKSQEGGLKTPWVTEFDFESLQQAAVHITVTSDTRVSQHVYKLLDAPITMEEFAIDGFPAPSLSESRELHRGLRPQAQEEPMFNGLEITCPSANTEVQSGQRINICVVPKHSFDAVSVMLIGPWGVQVDDQSPFEFEGTIPAERVGAVSIAAFGKDRLGKFAKADNVGVQTHISAALIGIRTEPTDLLLSRQAPTHALTLIGEYSDGISRTISNPSTELLLYSFNPSVAVIAGASEIEARGSGTTVILARYRAFEARVPVEIIGDPLPPVKEEPRQQLEALPLGKIGGVGGYPFHLNNAGQILFNSRGGRGSAIWQNGVFTTLVSPAGGDWIGANLLTETGLVVGDLFSGESRLGGPYIWWNPTNATLMGGYADGQRPQRDAFHPALAADSEDGLRIVWFLSGGYEGGSGAIYPMRNGFVPREPLPLVRAPPGAGLYGISAMNRHGTICAFFDKVSGSTPGVGGGVVDKRIAATIDRDGRVTVLPNEDPMVSAESINDLGWVAGSSYDLTGRRRSVLWRGSEMVVLPGGSGGAAIVNNRGHVAFEATLPDGHPGIAVWADGRVVRLSEMLEGEPYRFRGIGNLRAFNDRGWILCAGAAGTSDAEWFLVKLAPSITTQPVSRTKVKGDTVKFGVDELSFGARYQWRKNGVPLADGDRVSGTRSTTLTIVDIHPADAAGYDLLIVDAYGQAESSPATLTVLDGDCMPAASGIVGFWTGDSHEQEALNLPTARIVQSVPRTNAWVGHGFAFRRTNDAVITTLNTEAEVMPETTWDAWIYADGVTSGQDQVIMSAGEIPLYHQMSQRSLELEGGTGMLRLRTAPDSPWTVALLTTNEWHHIGVVFATNRVELHLDGKPYVRLGAPRSYEGDGRFCFGGLGSSWRHSFLGLIDEVTVYDRALSSEEIRAIYDLGHHGKCRPREAPTIAANPPAEVVFYQGEPLELSAKARGSAMLSVEWYRESTGLIEGQTNEQLRLDSAALTDAGTFWMVASNFLGTATSRSARVIVRTPCEPTWELVDRTGYPSASYDKLLFYDSKLKEMLQIQGAALKRWTGQTWAQEASMPSGFGSPYLGSVAYDPVRSVAVFFGGNEFGTPRSSTWEWESATRQWILAASSGPAPRFGHAMAFDSKRRRMVLFGGSGYREGRSVNFNDTWEWDGVEWLEVGSSAPDGLRPAPRWGHTVGYDERREKILLVGGSADGGLLGDTWTWEGDQWRPLFSSRVLPPRYRHTMVYLPARQSIVLFGGELRDGQWSGETWELAGDSWVRWPIPDARYDQHLPGMTSMAYDQKLEGLFLVNDGYGSWTLSWPRVPTMSLQPDSSARFVGETGTMSACASGQGLLTYQWLLDGKLANHDQTNSVLLWSTLRAADAGDYSFVASNSQGSVTSRVARLTVLPCLAMPSNALASWRFEGDASSATGIGDGIASNAVSFVAGKSGRALHFGDSPGHVLIKAETQLSLSQSRGWTVEGWIQAADSLARPILEWSYGQGTPEAVGVHLWTAPPGGATLEGSFYANVRDSARQKNSDFAASPDGLRPATWQHVALVYDRPSGRAWLYVDGTPATTAAVGSFRTATEGDIILGHRLGTTSFFRGLMDEFTVYSRALSERELSEIYRAGAAGKCDLPDGAPYIYVDSVRYLSDKVRLPSAGPAQVALLTTVADGVMRYSVDGSDPAQGEVYAGAFSVSVNALVRAATVDSSGKVLGESAQALQFDGTPESDRPALTGISRINSDFRLKAHGRPGGRYKLERSPDLVRWSAIVDATLGPEGEADLLDPSAPLEATFYRLRAD